MASTTPTRRALIVCDVQLGIIAMSFANDQDAVEPYVERCNTAIAHARAQGDKVIFIRVGFAPGHPEVGPKNKVRLIKCHLAIHDSTWSGNSTLTPICNFPLF